MTVLFFLMFFDEESQSLLELALRKILEAEAKKRFNFLLKFPNRFLWRFILSGHRTEAFASLECEK